MGLAFTDPVLTHLLPFLKFVNAFLSSRGLHHYLLTIRATTPTHEYDQPRWHTDDAFVADESFVARGNSQSAHRGSTVAVLGTDWKICTTLLGPQTLFVPAHRQSFARQKQRLVQAAARTDHVCPLIRCVGCASAADVVRKELGAFLAQCRPETPSPGQCAVFRVGRDSGAMHSEPCLSENLAGRIFINVIPGTQDELSVLMRRWGMEFPRDWYIRSHIA
ncbi:hypothetical protein QQS21_004503 [Conoideocrella luteorostrata]|uniref:Uncharacterized protein n=1 Tax=Conoideocrella luteorostrata TaxID=1105319 RepID=A0AAJ0CR71_9HYPO|nr:hypothetical protein QQS21_004503 [Conoideocrella luteorostrata]